MSDFTTRDGCFEAFLEQKKRADAAEAQLDQLRMSDEKQCAQVFFDLAEELDVQSGANPGGKSGSVWDAVMGMKAERDALKIRVGELQIMLDVRSIEVANEEKATDALTADNSALQEQLAAIGKLRTRTYITLLWQAIRDVCSVQTIGRIAMREKELRGRMS